MVITDSGSVDVEALSDPRASLVVTPSIGDGRRPFTITHKASGMRVCDVDTLERAKRAVQDLLPLVEWSRLDHLRGLTNCPEKKLNRVKGVLAKYAGNSE